MARAIWRAELALDGETVPVKLHSGIEDRRVHFRLLHAVDGVPVRQVMMDPRTGEEVPRERVRRGAEVEPGVYVFLDEEELAAAEPEPSRTIEVLRTVPLGRIGHPYYDRLYWLGPDTGGEEAYWALVAALEAERREAICRFAMRKRDYAASLRGERDALALVTLRRAEEVVDASELRPPGGEKPSAGEARMARQLVDALKGEFRAEDWRDEHRERVLELVEAKGAGRKPRLRKPKRREEPESISNALEASLAAARKERRSA